jgi:hypothetical protein
LAKSSALKSKPKQTILSKQAIAPSGAAPKVAHEASFSSSNGHAAGNESQQHSKSSSTTTVSFADAFANVCKDAGAPGGVDKKMDLDAVLSASRKMGSQHADAATEHMRRQVEQHLDHLEKKQVLADEMAQIMEQKGTGHKCKECDRIFEHPQKFCQEQGHSVTRINGIKRFFECKHCHARVTAFCTLYPKHPCPKCKNGDWTRVSLWKDFKGPELRPKMLPRGDEMGFSLRNDLLMMSGEMGDE